MAMPPSSQALSPLTSAQFGEIRLGERLGRGGEGEVFAINGQRDLVAKIYHNRLSDARIEKLKLMQQLTRPDLRQISAWPIDLIFVQGMPRGFVMPRAKDGKEIHLLYGPKSRKQHFPNAGFAFLVQCAANVARAVAVVHDSQLVIGDVNDRFVMVSNDATVLLIDCDSFQIDNGRQKYLCEVGVGTFTPPELQGQSFRGIVRSANNDNFGLAILLFHLLFLGRHPFAGRPQDGGDAGIEAAIQNCRFAYSRETARTRMLAPPGTVGPATVSPQVADLFERAFAPDGAKSGRPTARDWVTALTALAAALKECPENRSHSFHRDLGSCPWCNLEAATGWELFHYVPPANALPSIDVEATWGAITGLTFSKVSSPALFQPKQLPLTSNDAELAAEANRREAQLSNATAAREKAEQSFKKLENDLRQKEVAVSDADAHARNFEFDQGRLDELIDELETIKREGTRQHVWRWLIWLQFAGGLLAKIEHMPTVSATLMAGAAITAILSWLCRRTIGNAAELRFKIAELSASLALGPESRWDAHASAEAERHKFAERIPKAQTRLYRAQVAETTARDHLNALGDNAAKARQAIEKRMQNAAAAHELMETRYQELVDQRRQLEEFKVRRITDLYQAKTKLEELALGLKTSIKTLRDQQKEAQLARHLDKFFIADEEISGLGPVLKSTLASFGIETAADVTESAVFGVPGFGPGRTRTLIDWRQSKEVGFRFLPGQIDPAKRAALERQNVTDRRKHERQLRLGLQDLENKAAAFQKAVENYSEAARTVVHEKAIADYEAAISTGQVRGRPW